MQFENYFPANSVRICVDSSEGNISGRAYSPLTKDIIEFRDMGRLILTLDVLFDEKGYPQAFQDKRTFFNRRNDVNRFHGKPDIEMPSDQILDKKGDLATFDVMIHSRRNSSWQGVCYDDKHDEIGNFEGDMELMGILLSKIS